MFMMWSYLRSARQLTGKEAWEVAMKDYASAFHSAGMSQFYDMSTGTWINAGDAIKIKPRKARGVSGGMGTH